MNFLAPWFLLGALAVAGPVVFHLIRRSVRERTAFSSILFLRPIPPRATRRRHLEHILLLLLRCLALVLLALGFARPFFPKGGASPPPPGPGRQTVLLIDTSASMRRAGLWPKALAAAGQYLDKAAPGDRVAVLTFDQQVHSVVSFPEWLSWPLDQRAALTKQKLTVVSPGWSGTALGPALTEAAELFQEDKAGESSTRVVTLISDLQEGANLDGLQGHEWPKNVGVQVERMDPAKPGNAGLEILDASGAASGDERQARVRITNARDSGRETFTLAWDTDNAKPAQIYLPPGQTRTFSAPPLPGGVTTGALRLTGGGEDFDNTTWFAVPETERVAVAWFGSESANDPQQLRYYLERAFPETGRRNVEVVSVMSNSILDVETLNLASLAVVSTRLTAEESAALKLWVAGGKTELRVLMNALMEPADVPMEVSEAAGDYALLGGVDFTHPIFAPFADPRFSDFSRIHFWKHRILKFPTNFPVRVLAKFDDGSPALAQIPGGKGNLLVLASGWNPADSQLALSTKFVPLMQTILDWSGGTAPARAQFQIGDSVPAPAFPGDTVHWTKPDGKSVDQAAGAPFTGTDVPGIYLAAAGNRTNRFAVNLPLDESRTAPMSPDDLGRLGVPLQSAARVPAAVTAGTQRILARAELENRQKVWRWLIAGLLGVALVEIVLGGWLARRVANLETSS